MYKEKRNYYNVCGIEAEVVIDGMNMLHREGAAAKYLFRCNKIMPKGEIRSDLKKTRHYLSRCLEYEPIVRDYTADYWLDQINQEAFDNEIYLALYELIRAVGDPLIPYKERIEFAIEYVTNALERY